MSSSRRILVTQKIPEAGIAVLKRALPSVDLEYCETDEPIDVEKLKVKLPNKNGILLTLETKIKSDMLTYIGANLKCVSTMSVGCDHLDLKALKSLGVRVGHTPDVLTDTTAELVVALLLATTRRLVESHKCLLNGSVGRWNPNWMCGKDIKGSKVGFVGFGRIAQTVANLLSSFGVDQFLYCTRSTIETDASKPTNSNNSIPNNCHCVDMDYLLSNSDFVIVLCSSNESTKSLVNHSFLAKMKPDSILINASRGDVLDQNALLDALKMGTIRAAGLDVTTPEPLPCDHPLLHLPNCTVLPHIGSATLNTRNAMAVLAAENLLAALDGKTMPAEVDIQT